MFSMNFDAQSKLYSSLFELGTYNFQTLSALAKKNMEVSKEILGTLSEAIGAKKEEKQTPVNPFFPTTFNYIPNLYKERNDSFSPFNPFEMFQPKKSFSWPLPSNPFQAMEYMKNYSPMMSQTQPAFGGMPGFPFDPMKFSPIMSQMFKMGSQSEPSLKGFMMFFDIPLSQTSSEQNPMLKFYEMFNKD